MKLSASRPTRFLLPLLTLLAIAPLTLAASTSDDLKFEETTISHRATAEETKFTATYKFQNVGKEKVTIKKVNTSCGCTTAELTKKTYEPGEKGSLDATFTYDDKQGFQMKTISVDTGDGSQQLTLEVEIPDYLKIDVPLVTWEAGAKPEPQTFTITLDPEAPFKVIAGEFENPKAFKGELKETTPEGKKGRIYTFTVTPVSTEKFVKSIIYFKTDFPKDKPRSYKAFTMVKPASDESIPKNN